MGELEGDQTHQLEPHHHLVPLEDSELEEKQVDVPVVPPSSEEDSVPAEDSSVSATAELANDCGITNTKAPAPIAIENDVDAVTSISHKRPSPRVPEEALDHLLGPEVSIVQKDQKEPELLELDSATFTQGKLNTLLLYFSFSSSPELFNPPSAAARLCPGPKSL